MPGALSGSPNVHEYDDGARTTGGLLGGMRRGRAGAADEDDDGEYEKPEPPPPPPQQPNYQKPRNHQKFRAVGGSGKSRNARLT